MCIRDRAKVDPVIGFAAEASLLGCVHPESISARTEQAPVSYTHLDVYKRQGHDRALDANQIDENRRRHDIRDRIDRPHLVEVHLLDRQTVGLGLSLGKNAKSAAGECSGPRSERSGLDAVSYTHLAPD